MSSEANAPFRWLNFGWLFYTENHKAAICARAWCSRERDRSRPLSMESRTGRPGWDTGPCRGRQASRAFDSNRLAHSNLTKTFWSLISSASGERELWGGCLFTTSGKHRGLVVYCSVPYMDMDFDVCPYAYMRKHTGGAERAAQVICHLWSHIRSAGSGCFSGTLSQEIGKIFR